MIGPRRFDHIGVVIGDLVIPDDLEFRELIFEVQISEQGERQFHILQLLARKFIYSERGFLPTSLLVQNPNARAPLSSNGVVTFAWSNLIRFEGAS